MKTLMGILPWIVVLVVAGAVIWFLYDRHMAAGRWVFAAFLVAHGVIHLLYLAPAPEAAVAGGPEWPFDLGGSWLPGATGVEGGALRSLGLTLIGLVVVGFGLSGLATLGIIVPASWWPGLVVASSALSLGVLALFFAPSLLAGVAIDVFLIWLALASTWRPSLV